MRRVACCEKIRDRFPARILRQRQCDLHRQDVIRIKTGIDVLQTGKALHQ